MTDTQDTTTTAALEDGSFKLHSGNISFGEDLFLATLSSTPILNDLAPKISANVKRVIDVFVPAGVISYFIGEEGEDEIAIAFSWGPYRTEDEANESGSKVQDLFVAFDKMLEEVKSND